MLTDITLFKIALTYFFGIPSVLFGFYIPHMTFLLCMVLYSKDPFSYVWSEDDFIYLTSLNTGLFMIVFIASKIVSAYVSWKYYQYVNIKRFPADYRRTITYCYSIGIFLSLINFTWIGPPFGPIAIGGLITQFEYFGTFFIDV